MKAGDVNLATILADPWFPSLKRYVLSHTGLSYYADKDEDLAARVARRMSVLPASNCKLYLALLEGGEAGAREMASLVEALTIGETYFFRQVEHFDVLRSMIIPSLIERNAESRRIRIWSAGCATGEEPYSIAILLEQFFGAELKDWDVSILASDINSSFLARAKDAQYTEWAFRATPHEIREQCFDRHGALWTLRPAYRKRVMFQRLNLAAAPSIFSLDVFDLIFCRNVMIYFSADLIEETVKGFWEGLNPGGWLVVGHAEFNPAVFTKFARVCVRDVSVYQKPASSIARLNRVCTIPSVPPEAEPIPTGKRKELLPAVEAPTTATSPSGAGILQEVRDLADRGSWQAAASLGKHLSEREPLSAAAHFTLGLILESIASPAEAERSLRRAVYLDRNFALAHYHLASCLQNGGKEAQARKSFQNVIQLLKDRPADERVEHGDGMTGADLSELAKLHLEILEARERSA